MQVSHECPLELMDQSRVFNDYDYALVHLFENSNPRNLEYYSFFEKSLLLGRRVILDNSVFELENQFDSNRFFFWVNKLRPTDYIIPDKLEDFQATVDSIYTWLSTYPIINGCNSMGVIQGKSEAEAIECYKSIVSVVDKVAISFDYSFYLNYTPDDGSLTKWQRFAIGRQKFLDVLEQKSFFDKNKKYHLLGCSVPQEFVHYKNKPWYESVDTSNPIVHAIKGICYTDDGLVNKEKQKLVDLFATKASDVDVSILEHNLTKFYSFCNDPIAFNIDVKHNRWVAFFSQTGSEIINLTNNIGHAPDLIVTNKKKESISKEFLSRFEDKIHYLTDGSVESYSFLRESDVITLHGFLRIVPAEVCLKHNIFNLHPGLINVYPNLKGFNPQDKVLKNLSLYDYIGCVVHKVTPEVDAGSIIMTTMVPTQFDVYGVLKELAVNLWTSLLTGDN